MGKRLNKLADLINPVYAAQRDRFYEMQTDLEVAYARVEDRDRIIRELEAEIKALNYENKELRTSDAERADAAVRAGADPGDSRTLSNDSRRVRIWRWYRKPFK
jgi:hypothetical protein